ncbi:NUDIX hydrolase [Halorubellus sp. PRR65]|uniref:NUDIX hydrolase n=1 Tax=Halorubellus sp. PRR65 TaxID=3098148 RepID=UPI002B263666|nr:NUDIX hydrolase [Halorubellus sp. PRR65]
MDGFEGYADVVDPRERYDDLVEDGGEDVRDPERYREDRELEAFRSGWVAVGVVLDDADRVLCIRNADDERWLLPGGTLHRDESLDDGLVREVREETGVDVDPVRPRAVGASRIVNADDSDEWTGFHVVLYEARATDATVGEDLGVDDERITAADWFHDIPDPVFNPGLTRPAVRAARDR